MAKIRVYIVMGGGFGALLDDVCGDFCSWERRRGEGGGGWVGGWVEKESVGS